MEKDIIFKENIKLSEISSFKIGGEASLCLYPDSREKFLECISFAENSGKKYRVFGKTSNILFSDEKHENIYIFTENMRKISEKDGIIFAECGVPLNFLATFAMERGLSGVECLFGIPGSVGGAVYMNAGAYGGEIADTLEKSIYFDKKLAKICEIDKENHEFSYRKSIFQKNGGIVLSSEFALKLGDKNEIKAKMNDYMSRRKDKQPLDFPSAGSVFKRPEGYFAGELIEKSGLKGKRIGGAEVSQKHAGFIINVGNATANDVKMLIEHIKTTVYNNFGVMLECEIEII